MDFLSAGLGIMSMAGSIMGAQSKAAQQAASLEYSNTLNRHKTNLINKYRQQAYERRVDRVRDQLKENFSAANASWQTEQARFIEQMLGFSFQQADMTKQLLQAEGMLQQLKRMVRVLNVLLLLKPWVTMVAVMQGSFKQ